MQPLFPRPIGTPPTRVGMGEGSRGWTAKSNGVRPPSASWSLLCQGPRGSGTYRVAFAEFARERFQRLSSVWRPCSGRRDCGGDAISARSASVDLDVRLHARHHRIRHALQHRHVPTHVACRSTQKTPALSDSGSGSPTTVRQPVAVRMIAICRYTPSLVAEDRRRARSRLITPTPRGSIQ
jgi:hypothetical protein